jgi:hypothetical protein
MGFWDGGGSKGSRGAILIVNLSFNIAQDLEVSCAMDFYRAKDVSTTQTYHRFIVQTTIYYDKFEIVMNWVHKLGELEVCKVLLRFVPHLCI